MMCIQWKRERIEPTDDFDYFTIGFTLVTTFQLFTPFSWCLNSLRIPIQIIHLNLVLVRCMRTKNSKKKI